MSGRHSRKAEVYTDGACRGNGRNDPQAGIGVYWGPNSDMNVSQPLEGRQTNNRAEIHAAAKACEQARGQGIDELTINTDSKFLVDSMNKWAPRWQENGWRKADGREVVNRQDFETLQDSSRGMTVNYRHVPGHSGHHGNEQADRLAQAGADRNYREGQGHYRNDYYRNDFYSDEYYSDEYYSDDHYSNDY